jgi:hypothetical protein
MKIKMLYIGKRVWNQKRMLPCFVDPNGEECFFGRTAHVRKGYYYEGEKTDDSIKMPVIPVELEYSNPNETTIQQWEQFELLAYTFSARKRASNRDKHHITKVASEFPKLQKIVTKMNFLELKLFTESLINELHKRKRT